MSKNGSNLRVRTKKFAFYRATPEFNRMQAALKTEIPDTAVITKTGGWLKPFQKGQSGNPGGKSEGQKECLALAREASPIAMKKLIDLMQSYDDRVAIMAADKVLERAYGKAKEQPAEDSAPKIDLSKCPPEALALIKQALAMMAGTVPTQTVIPPDPTTTSGG